MSREEPVGEPVPLAPLGVWRSLVARSVRVGEAPSSNLGTPIAWAGEDLGFSPACPSGEPGLYPRGVSYVSRVRTVIFDVDFTLVRPGPDLGASAYRELGRRYGLELDVDKYEEAREASFAAVERHPDLDHDEEIWIRFTERIIIGMGGRGETYSAAVEMERRWVHAAHFELYDDALPALERLRAHGLKIGLLSNSSRDLGEFVAHHGLVVDAALTSHVHGKTKPHESIFRALLDRLQASPEEAVMVGDTVDDDVVGARAVGMRAILVDRYGRYPAFEGRLDDLTGLPAALGLN